MPSDRTTNSRPPLSSGTDYAVTSYSFNGQVFDDPTAKANTVPSPRIPESFPDGTSNTVFTLERYAICSNKTGGTTVTGEIRTWGDGAGYSQYAEAAYLTDPNNDTPNAPGVVWVDKYVKTVFQVAPIPASCIATADLTANGGTNGRANAATPHSSMNLLMGDGSVRQVAGSISLTTFRAILTPGGADIPGADWGS
jgi:hypothetical protein